MEDPHAGDLVKVSDDGPDRDGIVFDTPSASKVVVAIVHPRRGPVFRTVSPKALTERPDVSPHDDALNRLIRRTPPPSNRGPVGSGPQRNAQPGHSRAAGHRTTGK
jgi:hypothetical protein